MSSDSSNHGLEVEFSLFRNTNAVSLGVGSDVKTKVSFD